MNWIVFDLLWYQLCEFQGYHFVVWELLQHCENESGVRETALWLHLPTAKAAGRSRRRPARSCGCLNRFVKAHTYCQGHSLLLLLRCTKRCTDKYLCLCGLGVDGFGCICQGCSLVFLPFFHNEYSVRYSNASWDSFTYRRKEFRYSITYGHLLEHVSSLAN